MGLASNNLKVRKVIFAVAAGLLCLSCGSGTTVSTGRNNQKDTAPAQGQQNGQSAGAGQPGAQGASNSNAANSVDDALRERQRASAAGKSANPSPSPSAASQTGSNFVSSVAMNTSANSNGAQGTGGGGTTVVEFNSKLNVSGPTSCRVKIPQCPAQTSVKTGVFFEDNFEGASNDSNRCLKRATDYATWCELPVPLEATAHFVQGDVLLAQTTGMRDGCRVLVGRCPAQPSLSTIGVFFRDDFENASSNKDRCLARAKDFVTWCGIPAGFEAKAQFQKDGVVETRTEKPGT